MNTSSDSTLSGELDTRPGHYYVVSHKQCRQPEEGYRRLAGPWPTHKEADDQVAAVREYAKRYDYVEASRQHFVTARMPIVEGVEALPSKLGSNSRVWLGRRPTQEEIAIYLSKHKDYRGITSTGLSVLVCREGATVLCPVALLTADERMYDSSRGRFTKDEREDARQYGVELPGDAPTTIEQVLGAAVAKSKRRGRR